MNSLFKVLNLRLRSTGIRPRQQEVPRGSILPVWLCLRSTGILPVWLCLRSTGILPVWLCLRSTGILPVWC